MAENPYAYSWGVTQAGTTATDTTTANVNNNTTVNNGTTNTATSESNEEQWRRYYEWQRYYQQQAQQIQQQQQPQQQQPQQQQQQPQQPQQQQPQQQQQQQYSTAWNRTGTQQQQQPWGQTTYWNQAQQPASASTYGPPATNTATAAAAATNTGTTGTGGAPWQQTKVSPYGPPTSSTSSSTTTTHLPWQQQQQQQQQHKASPYAPPPASSAQPTTTISQQLQAAAEAAAAAIGKASLPWKQPRPFTPRPQQQQQQQYPWATSAQAVQQQSQPPPPPPQQQQQQSQQQQQQQYPWGQQSQIRPSYAGAVGGDKSTAAAFTWNKPKPNNEPTPEQALGISSAVANRANSAATSSNNGNVPSAKDWPPALQDYVQRNFAKCNGDIEIKLIEQELRRIIKSAHESNKLWSTAWQSMPLIDVTLKQKQHYYRSDSDSEKDGRKYNEKSPTKKKKPMWDDEPPTSTSSSAPFMISSSSQRAKLAKELKQAKKNKRKMGKGVVVSEEKRTQRSRRFEDPSQSSSKKNGWEEDEENIFADLSEPIKGTCTNVEKHFIRITCVPDPATVRPRHILVESLKYVIDQQDKGADYEYLCDQLKAIRQDLTLQHIRDDLTVKTYETHTRFALLNEDISEFCSCQNMLKILYREIGGENCGEFQAYRLLYWTFQTHKHELQRELLGLTPQLRQTPEVAHALNVRSAYLLPNYPLLFKLWPTAPHLGAEIIGWFIPHIRDKMFAHLLKSHKPVMSLDFICRILAFTSLEDEEFQQFSQKQRFVKSPKDEAAIDVRLTTDAIAKAEAESDSEND